MAFSQEPLARPPLQEGGLEGGRVMVVRCRKGTRAS